MRHFLLTFFTALSLVTNAQVHQIQLIDSTNKQTNITGSIIDAYGNIMSVCNVARGGSDNNILIKTDITGDITYQKGGLYIWGENPKLKLLKNGDYVSYSTTQPRMGLYDKNDTLKWAYNMPFWVNGSTRSMNVIELPSGNLVYVGYNRFRRNGSWYDLFSGWLTKVNINDGQVYPHESYAYEYDPYHKGDIFFHDVAYVDTNILAVGTMDNSCYIWKFDTSMNYRGSFTYTPAFTLNSNSYWAGKIMQIHSINGKTYLSGTFHNKLSITDTALREAHFVVEYNTQTDSIHGKMFAFHNRPYIGSFITHISDTNEYFFVGGPTTKNKFRAPAYKDIMLTKVKNGNIEFTKKISDPATFEIQNLLVKKDTIILTGNYADSLGYFFSYDQQSSFYGNCDIVDTSIISLDISGVFSTGLKPTIFQGLALQTQGFESPSAGFISAGELCSSDTSFTSISQNFDLKYSISIHPNPNSGSFVVNSSGTDIFTIDNLSILDLFGRSIKYEISKSTSNSYNIKLEDYTHGMLICIITVNSEQLAYKVIVE